MYMFRYNSSKSHNELPNEYTLLKGISLSLQKVKESVFLPYK